MPRPTFARLISALCLWTVAALPAGLAGPASAADPVRVVVTIKPIHSLVAGVMEGVSTPSLLISGGGSPHSYALKPSDANALRQAQIVVRVSDHLETFLDKPIRSLAKDARVVTIDELDGLTLLEPREGGAWEEHAHHHEDGKDDHAEHEQEHSEKAEDHAEHEHEHEHAEKAEDHAEHEHEKGEEHHAEHEGHNTHLWLDPRNAKIIVMNVVKALGQADPDNAERYRINANKMLSRLEALDTELKAATRPLADKRFIVFHDAYPYFERRYGLTAAGSITVSPERQPGARRLTEIRDKIAELGATCVFAEPQFEPKLVQTVIAGTQAKSGVLDPLGAELEPGPDLYFQLMRGLAKGLADCLS